MKTLEELNALRDKMESQVGMRRVHTDQVKIRVAMGTRGVEAGARAVVTAFSDEILGKKLTSKAIVVSDGNIPSENGVVVVIDAPGSESVTLENVTPDKAAEILSQYTA